MAEEQVQDVKPASVYTLKQPITFEGAQVTELNLDFDQLTGEDVIKCDMQFAAMDGATTFFKEANRVYQAVVTARAAGVPVELIKALKAKDFTRVTLRAQNFLIGTD